MTAHRQLTIVAIACVMFGATQRICAAQSAVRLPQGVKAVWDLSKAYRETTPMRERICINGLWRRQPCLPDKQATATKTDRVPDDNWGYFKVPGCWPGITDYMQKDCQTVHAHRSWQDESLAGVAAAWYQREITIPAAWTGRRIAVYAEYLNSYAAVYVDGHHEPPGAVRLPRVLDRRPRLLPERYPDLPVCRAAG